MSKPFSPIGVHDLRRIVGRSRSRAYRHGGVKGHCFKKCFPLTARHSKKGRSTGPRVGTRPNTWCRACPQKLETQATSTGRSWSWWIGAGAELPSSASCSWNAPGHRKGVSALFNEATSTRSRVAEALLEAISCKRRQGGEAAISILRDLVEAAAWRIAGQMGSLRWCDSFLVCAQYRSLLIYDYVDQVCPIGFAAKDDDPSERMSFEVNLAIAHQAWGRPFWMFGSTS